MTDWQQYIEKCVNRLIYIDQLEFDTAVFIPHQQFHEKFVKALGKKLQRDAGKDEIVTANLLKRASNCSLVDRLSFLNAAVRKSPKNIVSYTLIERQNHINDFPTIFPELDAYRQFFNGDATTPSVPSMDESADFPYASKSLRIVQSDEMGRHVVSGSELRRGDVLFLENPVASAVLIDHNGEYCHYCCSRLYDLIPCDECATVAYCSEECKQNDWVCYHYVECGFVTFLQSRGVAYLALRCILSVGSHEQLLAKVENLEKSKSDLEADESTGRGYEALFNLTFQSENLQCHDLASYGLTVLLLVTFLKVRTSYFPPDVTADVLLEVGQVLLRHMLQLIRNAHSIVVPVVTADETGICSVEQTMVATAIYPSASVMNHSCRPNIVNSFVGNKLIVRASEDIGPGEAVWNCYGPRATEMNLIDRQESLLEQYGFQCKCSACLEPYDLMDLVDALKCRSCFGPLILEVSNSVLCKLCDRMTRITPDMLEDRDRADLLAKLFAESNYGNNVDIDTQHVLTIWLKIRKSLYCWNVNLVDSTQLLATCLVRDGYLTMATRLLSVAAKVVSKCYTQSSQHMLNFYLSLSATAKQALMSDDEQLTEPRRREFETISQKAEEEIYYLKMLHYNFVAISSKQTEMN